MRRHYLSLVLTHHTATAKRLSSQQVPPPPSSTEPSTSSHATSAQTPASESHAPRRVDPRTAPAGQPHADASTDSVDAASARGAAALRDGFHQHLNSDYRRFRTSQDQEDARRRRQARRPDRMDRDNSAELSAQPRRAASTDASARRRPHFAHDEAFWDDESTSAGAAPVPMVHPGATGLPPLGKGAKAAKFSFVAHTSEKAEKDFYSHSGVPNNTPKPLLPMWASSLTSPALGKQRLEQENWISSDSLGYITTARTRRFLSWLTSTAPAAEEATDKEAADAPSSWPTQLESNVDLLLRKHQCRGVYAKRSFAKDDVIFRIPLFRVDQPSPTAAEHVADGQAVASPGAPAWARTLNAEVLAQCSAAARDRAVPSYASIQAVLSVQRSSFDPVPHPLFIDQMHLAMLLACERAEGSASPLAPYLSLFNDCDKADDMASGQRPLIDDDHIQDLYRGVLEPPTHLEYRDHMGRFDHYARELYKCWWETYTAMDAAPTDVSTVEKPESEGMRVLHAPPLPRAETIGVRDSDADNAVRAVTEASSRSARTPTPSPPLTTVPSSEAMSALRGRRPPPPIEDLQWAMRFVLSRQRVLPRVRVEADAVMAAEAEQEGWEKRELDWFARAVVKAKLAIYDHVFGAVDREKVHVNAFDAHSAPTVVPLLDLLQHPSNGVPNTVYAVEDDPTGTASTDPKEEAAPASQPWLVVRAAEDIEQSDELTLQFQRGYSVSYSLYRYGFLPLRQREDDMRDFLAQHGVDGDNDAAKTHEVRHKGSV